MKNLPSPRQLQYLVALVETNHFGRAAQRCFVTQSTLSVGLKELESLLGVTLVERSKRKVVVTPLGRMMAARARETVRYLEDMVELARSGSGVLAGPLSLGVIPTIGPYLLPKLMTAARDKYPDLKLFVREDQTAPSLERLRRGELDIALIALPYDTGDLDVFELGEEDIVACLPANHRLAIKKALTEDDIASAPILTLEDGHCLRDHALAACRLTNRKFNEVFQATSLSTLVQMVAEGLGICMLPRMAVDVEVQGRSGLIIRPLADAGPARTIVLCWRKTSVRAEDFRKLGKVFKAVFSAST